MSATPLDLAAGPRRVLPSSLGLAGVFRFLDFPRVLLLAVLVGGVLRLPALRVGFLPDEELQLSALEGHPLNSMTRFDLWRFYSGVPADTARMVHDGLLPFWAHPQQKLSFLRPFSSVVFAGEQAVFGRSTVVSHGITLVAALGLIVVAGAMFRRLLPGRVAGAALLLFAVQQVQWDVTALVCARHFLLAAVPSVLGLTAYLRYRQGSYPRGWLLGLAGFSLGLLFGETALQVLAFVLAYELFGATDPLLRRLRAIAGPALLGVGYLVVYVGLGYGASHVEFAYADPIAEPRLWLGHVYSTGGLVLDLLAGFHATVTRIKDFTIAPGSSLYGYRVAVLLLAGALWGLLFLAFSRGPLFAHAAVGGAARTARWLLVGAMFSIVPAAGAVASPRLVVIAGLGVAPAVALVLRFGWAGLSGTLGAGAPRRLALAAGAVAGGVHAVLSPIALPANLWAYADGLVRGREHSRQLARGCEIRGTVGEDVLVLATPVLPEQTTLRRVFPEARPFLNLGMGRGDHEVIRTGPNSFELATRPSSARPASASLYPAVGQEIALRSGFTVRVLAAAADGLRNEPSRIAVTSERSLDTPDITFLAWKNGKLSRVAMPPAGGRVVVNRVQTSPPS